jgi:hypothetical protein
MRKSEWVLYIDDEEYKIEFFPHMFFKFRYKLLINNVIITNVNPILNKRGADYNFEIKGHNATITLRVNKLSSTYDLIVDGKSTTTKNLVALFYSK